MTPLERINLLLQNSGIEVLGPSPDYSSIVIKDPSCVLIAFGQFMKYAWVIITVIAAFLLLGWAISLIRGAKNDLFKNIRNLFIMFATLSLAIPIVNMIYGEDIFKKNCQTVSVPIETLNSLLEARDKQLGNRGSDLYEHIDIHDSESGDDFEEEIGPDPEDEDWEEEPEY